MIRDQSIGDRSKSVVIVANGCMTCTIPMHRPNSGYSYDLGLSQSVMIAFENSISTSWFSRV